MPVEQPSNIYREKLTSLYHGLALWKPNPAEDIYNQVSIGDVGYISSEGIFIRMFNVTLPWNDPSNRRLAEPEPYDPLTLASITRENFGQVDYYSRHVSREENAGNIHAATHEQTEGVTYICRGPGALLSLPCGGYREDAIHKIMFRERIRDNVDSWFNWSRNADLPVDRMDDLILVTGCTLVTSYASAVLDDYIADAQISLVSRPLNNGGASFVWRNIRGTIEYHDSRLNPNIPSAPRNRCVFIRGFRAKRVLFWTKPIRAAAGPHLDDPDDPDDPDDNGIEDMQVNEVPYDPKYLDPLNGVLDYIAEKCLEANAEGALAIAHDDDLQIVKSKDLETLTADAVLKFLHETKIPVIIENGVATLQGDITRNQSRGDQVPQGQDSQLHFASHSEQVEDARMLIDSGASVTAQNKDGDMAIHLASHQGQINVVHMLIKHGADVTAQNIFGDTPLHLALCQGQVDVARMLIEHGGDVTAHNMDGDTPLHLASYQGQVDVVRMLIEHGADVTAQNTDGDTPLHLALYQGQVDVARMLIEHGADVTAQNVDGDTPLHMASSCQGQVDVSRTFIDSERSADATAQNTDASPATPGAACRLPPTFQVEQQPVTISATQAASASQLQNEANFLCPVSGCGRTFTRRYNLKVHLGSHTQVRRYRCGWPGCIKTFSRKHDCNRHQASHSEKSQFYACQGCGKTFSHLDDLNLHLLSGSKCQTAQKASTSSNSALESAIGLEARASSPDTKIDIVRHTN